MWMQTFGGTKTQKRWERVLHSCGLFHHFKYSTPISLINHVIPEL